MRWLARLGFLFLFALPAFGQGYRYDNFVLKPLAAGGVTPVSGALITVCTSAGSGTPCTPKVANIYSDEALTQAITGSGGAGTTNSDANGNFGFYIAPGSYIVTVTGTGITSYTIKLTLPCNFNNCALTFKGPGPWIDVTNPTYGATGNGTTDDAAAIQAALNALPVPGGAKVFFPCGNYLVKSTLIIPLNSDSDIMGEGQGCAKIIKDFDSTPLFRSANSSYGTQTTLTANANIGDERLTVSNSAGFVVGGWVQLDDNTGVTASVNCLSYTAYEPAALSCNLGIYRIRSIPDSGHIDITTSLDEAYTTAGLARVSAITPFTASFHDLYFAHGPDCAAANSCTGRMIDLIFPIESELQHLTMDVGRTIAVAQFHRGKHIKYHDCVIRNGDDSLTKNGLGANTVIFDEASAYWEFGPDNNMYKAGETVAQGQSHHGEFHHNTFNGCADSCINTHGNKDHDISMSYNIMGGGSTSDTQNTVSARCVIVSDTDFNINVDNNVCRNFSQAGIQVVATTQFSIANISIINNQIFTPITSTGVFPPNYFLSTTTNPPIGINVQGVDNPKIMGNTISGAFPANSLGIQIASSRRALIVGNHVTQTATVSGDIGIYHITNAAQPSTQMTLIGNVVTGWNSSNCRFDLGASTFAGLNLTGNDCATGPGGTYVYGAGITAISRVGNVGEGFGSPEVAAPTGLANIDFLYPDSTAHRWKAINNNGSASTFPYLESSDAWTGTESFAGNTAALTADWTCGTGGTVSSCVAATIIGSGGGVPLTFTLPLFARSYTLECDGVVGQATAVTANQWNLLTATNGATNVTANYSMATAATASAYGAVTDQASTTTTFQIAPSWTLGGTATKMPFHIWAKVEGASASGTVLSLQLVAPTVGDLVTIYRGTACRIF